MMITLIQNTEEVALAPGEIRAGGTDLQERLRSRITRSSIVDISRLPGLETIDHEAEGTTLGALTKVADIGRSEHIISNYPALAFPAQLLATPQIREMATLGGVLCQRNRCWYYRNPHFDCYKKGGDHCPARVGNYELGTCVDSGPCIAPHPSSIGLALLTYDAEVEVTGRGRITIADLYGDGSDPTHDHTLQPGEMIMHVYLPAPASGERAGYHRQMSRALAEWPLVEVVVRLLLDGDTIREARVAVNGLANRPVRLPAAEKSLAGKKTTEEAFDAAAEAAIAGLVPLPMTAYKVGMIRAGIVAALTTARDHKPGEKLML
jgi:xanthine dehydrogenase YagS FAD-binding subunit